MERQRAIARVGLLAGCIPLLAIGQETTKPVSAIPADRRADSYAIYSRVLARPNLSHASESEKYLIEEFSGSSAIERMSDPLRCIAAPGPFRAAFNELLADRAAHADERYRLERAFTIAKPYDLVTEDQAAQFRNLRNTPGHSTGDVDLFRGATDLFTLGNVYFDRNRTLAAVYMWAWCGSLCGSGTWRVFTNAGGGWQEQKWVNCFTVARSIGADRAYNRKLTSIVAATVTGTPFL
jgi:hypothetical protein